MTVTVANFTLKFIVCGLVGIFYFVCVYLPRLNLKTEWGLRFR